MHWTACVHCLRSLVEKAVWLRVYRAILLGLALAAGIASQTGSQRPVFVAFPIATAQVAVARPTAPSRNRLADALEESA